MLPNTPKASSISKGPKPTLLFSLPLAWLLSALALWTGLGAAHGQAPAGVNAESQAQVAQLLQTVIQDYWSRSEAGSAAGKQAGAETNVEAAFRKASKLMPDRLDLRFGIASSLVLQAIHTNGQRLEMKVKEALKVYQEIEALDTNGFEAPLLYAAYARGIGETNVFEASIHGLMATHPRRTAEYLQRFTRIDRTLQFAPNERPPRTMPKDNHHAIVVLGAGLETNGTIKPKLKARLDQCWKLARIYPKAPIILSGGNQKGGITEAYAMGLWCQQRGIPRKRLILEDKARDTVENGMFCAAILQRLGVTHVTLVTSTSHMRRGLADLQEACLQRGLNLHFENLGAKKADEPLDKEQERVGIYRDVLRISGLWAFPGLQR